MMKRVQTCSYLKNIMGIELYSTRSMIRLKWGAQEKGQGKSTNKFLIIMKKFISWTQTTCMKDFVNWWNLTLTNTKISFTLYIKQEKVENKWHMEWVGDEVVFYLASNKTPWREYFIAWVRMCKWGGGCYDDYNQHYKAIKPDASVTGWEKHPADIHSLSVVSTTGGAVKVLLVYSVASRWLVSLEGHAVFSVHQVYDMYSALLVSQMCMRAGKMDNLTKQKGFITCRHFAHTTEL